jgi:alcohol oxidase
LVVLKGKTYAPLDMSITPSNAGCYNTALAIGKKAAVIIAEDLGIEGVTEE